MMLLCCSFASASSTSRNPSSLSVDRSNSKIHTICRASLIATPSGRMPQKWFTKKNAESRLHQVFWLFLTGIVTSMSCVSSASSSLLQILRKSSHRHSVLLLLFIVKCDRLELTFWFLCSMHDVIQVHPDGVLGSRNCRCHPFASCTIDITVCFVR